MSEMVEQLRAAANAIERGQNITSAARQALALLTGDEASVSDDKSKITYSADTIFQAVRLLQMANPRSQGGSVE